MGHLLDGKGLLDDDGLLNGGLLTAKTFWMMTIFSTTAGVPHPLIFDGSDLLDGTDLLDDGRGDTHPNVGESRQAR